MKKIFLTLILLLTASCYAQQDVSRSLEPVEKGIWLTIFIAALLGGAILTLIVLIIRKATGKYKRIIIGGSINEYGRGFRTGLGIASFRRSSLDVRTSSSKSKSRREGREGTGMFTGIGMYGGPGGGW